MLKNGIAQWGWTEMEELLQCPVCLDIPAVGLVEQCRHGHHICVNCKKNVDTCPLCKCEFLGTRNFVLEELVRHFDILKNTMLLNNIVSEAKHTNDEIKKPEAPDNSPSLILKSIPPRRMVHTPNSPKGCYPCRALDCDVSLPLCRLLNHARTFHADILTESMVDFREIYTKTFEIILKTKKAINKNSFIMFVSGIGLVYLNIEIMRSGQVAVFLQMASKFTKCQEYLGALEFYSESYNYSWNTKLISTKHGFPGMMKTFHCFTLNKTQIRHICENKKFKCKLRLTRFDTLNSNVLTQPNTDQIMIICAIRASLVSEQYDKKLIKELEVHKNKKIVTKVATSQDNGQAVDFHNLVSDIMQNLGLHDARGSISGNASNNPTSENVTPNHPVAGKKQKKKRFVK